LDLGGYPVTLVDTAGLRETSGLVEQEGIRRARARASQADLVLWLSETGGEPATIEGDFAGPVVRIGTKADLIESGPQPSWHPAKFDQTISTVTGFGLDRLIERLAAFMGKEFQPRESDLIMRARHRAALTACVQGLDAALGSYAKPEIRAEELRRAGDALGRLAGRIDVEDVLDAVFREFCIGK
jgi:tRNA modification GTPase